jgi:hypothetical protein
MDLQKFYTLLSVPTAATRETVSELKSLRDGYPWFSLAHQLLMEVACRNGDEDRNRYELPAAAYSASRSCFYWRLQQPTAVHETETVEDVPVVETPVVETPPPVPPAPAPTGGKPYYAAGGDYFSSSELPKVEGEDPVSRFIITQPKINPNTSPLNAIDLEDIARERTTIMDYVTETLAQIYRTQQLYDLAVATYEKLILQIPEKSTYFATQIKEIRIPKS